jgi:hypothetical protein
VSEGPLASRQREAAQLVAGVFAAAFDEVMAPDGATNAAATYRAEFASLTRPEAVSGCMSAAGTALSMVVERSTCTFEDADRRTVDVLARCREGSADPGPYEHGAKLLDALVASRDGGQIRLTHYVPDVDDLLGAAIALVEATFTVLAESSAIGIAEAGRAVALRLA